MRVGHTHTQSNLNFVWNYITPDPDRQIYRNIFSKIAKSTLSANHSTLLPVLSGSNLETGQSKDDNRGRCTSFSVMSWIATIVNETFLGYFL